MTVKELIKGLQSEDPDRIVIFQKDPEGNGYSPLANWWAGAYKAETTWCGEAGMDKLTDDDMASGYTEEDVLEGGVPALFLYPIS
jgi:hypothetical protein